MRDRVLLPVFVVGLVLVAEAAGGAALTGKVMDAHGAPVANAAVWVCRHEYPRGDLSLRTECATLQDGTFSAEVPERAADDEGPLFVYAHREGLTLGFSMAMEPTAAVEVRLSLPGPIAGSVRNVAGRPIAGAKVTPTLVVVEGGASAGSFVIPDALQGAFATTTDDSGAFRFLFTAEGARPNLTVSAAGYGSLVAYSRVDLAQIRMAPAGSIEGRITGADDPSIFAGMELAASTADPGGLLGVARMAVKADGTFLADEAAPGTYRISAADVQPPTWHIRGVSGVSVRPGERTVIEIPAARTAPVRGRILAADTGQGLADAQVSLSQYSPASGAMYSTWGLADAEGRYEIPCLPGATQLYASSLGYIARSDEGWQIEVGPQGAVAPDTTLEPACSLGVLVVDEAGAPVAGAGVSLRQSAGDARSEMAIGPVTGNDGTYTWERLISGPATVQARKGAALSEEIAVEVGRDGVREPVRLVLMAGQGATVTVRIADQDGRPVAGATAEILEQREGSSSSTPAPTPDAEGRVTQTGLLPGASCRITVSAPGAFAANTAWWLAEAGATHDFGTLTVRLCTGRVSGMVVDENGMPLAGARVFDPLDAPEVREARTDAAGRFALEGLAEGAVCVFAESPERAMACVLAETGADDVRLTLLPRQPGAIGDPVPSPAIVSSEEEAKARAAQVLTAAFADGTWARWQHQRQGLLGLLARVDPAAAYDAAAKAGLSTEGIALALARQATEGDIDEAISLVRQAADPTTAILELGRLVGQVRDGDPEGAVRCLEAAMDAAARVGNAPNRAGLTAFIGGQLARLGDPRGETALREAQALVQNIGVAGWDGYMRGMVAENLAEVDVDQALALMGTIEEKDERDRHLGNIIRRAAAIDPGRAAALLDEIGSDWHRVLVCARAVAFFPAEQLDKAIDLARGIDEAPQYRGLALARLAWVAPEARKADLIEEAAEVLSAPDQPGSDRMRDAVALAHLACAARQLGYEGYEELAMRALSRSDAANDGSEFVLALSFLRPDLARYFGESMLVRRGGIERFDPGVVGVFLRSIAAVAPDRAVELFLAWPTVDEPRDDYSIRFGAVAFLVEALLDGPAKQEQAILTDQGDGVIPTEEDD